MLYDELKEQLNNCKPDLEIINNYWKSSNIDVELKKLYEISNTESFWQNNEQTIILKKT